MVLYCQKEDKNYKNTKIIKRIFFEFEDFKNNTEEKIKEIRKF